MVPLIEISEMETERIGVGMYPSLMGTFNFPTPVLYIRATLGEYSKWRPSIPVTRVSFFRTTYFEDPWVLPSPCESMKGCVILHDGMAMPLSKVEMTYRAIQ
jgi:hypothetical protein